MMSAAAGAGDGLLLDDFTGDDTTSALGTRWTGFTDRVMGGRSDMQVGIVTDSGRPMLRMRGTVRLDNNGGFIQARLPLDASGATLDASAWRGVRVELRGTPGPYFLHLRTPDCRRPWQYYRAELPVTAGWREVFVPFTAFSGQSIAGPIDLGRLRSLALVAYGEAFEAELEIRRLFFAD